MTGVGVEDFAGVSFTGRRLWTIQARERLLVHADRLVHRLHIHDHDGRWPCFESDDAWLRRFVHDPDFRARAAVHMTRVEVTGQPR